MQISESRENILKNLEILLILTLKFGTIQFQAMCQNNLTSNLLDRSSNLAYPPNSPFRIRKTFLTENRKEIWLQKWTPTPKEHSWNDKETDKKRHQNSITERNRTDLKRSAGVTTATELVLMALSPYPLFITQLWVRTRNFQITNHIWNKDKY